MSRNVKMLAIVSAPVVLALCGGFGPIDEEACPLVCAAVPTGMAGGINIGPPGTSFSVSFGPKVDGNGMDDPCAACPGKPCKEGVQITFNGNGTGWCLRYTYGPLGSSNPLTEYYRGGYIAAPCDDNESLQLEIVSCSGGGNPWFSGTRHLACNCP